MDFPEVLRHFVAQVINQAGVKSVYGDPITHGRRTVVPVARVMYGFGGGGEIEEGETEGGGGGGLIARPVGVLEITDEGTNYIPIISVRRLLGAALLGFAFGYWFTRAR